MRELDACCAGDGHLRGNMDGKIRRNLADQPAHAYILHNHRIRPGGYHGPQVLLRLRHFILKNQRVEGDVAFYAASVQKVQELWQIGFCEVLGSHSGVEFVQPEIDSVRAVLDGGPGAVPVAGRGKQVGNAECARPP